MTDDCHEWEIQSEVWEAVWFSDHTRQSAILLVRFGEAQTDALDRVWRYCQTVSWGPSDKTDILLVKRPLIL